MTKNTIGQHEVREFITSLLQRKGDVKPFADADSLVLSGRLDSLDVLDIVVFLETRCQFDFGDRPFDQHLLDSVDQIAELIAAA